MILQSDFERMTRLELQTKYDELIDEMDFTSSNLQGLPFDGGSPAEKQIADELTTKLVNDQALAAKIFARLKGFKSQDVQIQNAGELAKNARAGREWQQDVERRQQQQHEQNKRHLQQGWGNSTSTANSGGKVF